MDFAGFLSFYLLEQHVSEKELRSQDGNFLPAEGTWLILFKQQTTTVLCYLLTLRLIFRKYLTTLSGIVVLWLGLYHISWRYFRWKGIPWWFRDKESTCNGGDAEDTGSNPWVRKIPWKRNVNPLQYSCLENPMDRGVRQATVHGVTKELDTTTNNNSVSL